MATFSLPRGRNIEVSATVNARFTHRVQISGPGVELDWSGTGEGVRIGQTVISFPAGEGPVAINTKLTFSAEDGVSSPSHEKVIEERELGQVHVLGEDGRGTLDGNDLIVKFHWVA